MVWEIITWKVWNAFYCFYNSSYFNKCHYHKFKRWRVFCHVFAVYMIPAIFLMKIGQTLSRENADGIREDLLPFYESVKDVYTHTVIYRPIRFTDGYYNLLYFMRSSARRSETLHFTLIYVVSHKLRFLFSAQRYF